MVHVKYYQELFNKLLNNMTAEGILDATEFKNLQTSLEDDPAFLVDIIEESCIECCKTIQEMNNYLYQPVVDFCKVDVCVHKIKGPCLYIGARRVILACVGFRQALDEKDKERCIHFLEMINHEFSRVSAMFEDLVKIGRRILTHNAKLH